LRCTWDRLGIEVRPPTRAGVPSAVVVADSTLLSVVEMLPSGDNDCMAQAWPNDPDDDGNALAGVLHAVLAEAGVVGLVVLLWWWVAIVP
jgi:hypothetical protein